MGFSKKKNPCPYMQPPPKKPGLIIEKKNPAQSH
jgi:hypothetical protein